MTDVNQAQPVGIEARADKRNSRVAMIVGSVVMLMVGMAYAAVPLYEVFCRVTGYGGTTQRADATEAVVVDRDVKMRFTANLHAEMSWEFRPMQNRQEIKVGEQAMAFYKAKNPTSRAITGTATFNVTPHKAGIYFAKIECFCFTEQTLQPGEEMEMPVVYFVDPAFAEDPDMDDVREITLSYTFFEQAGSEAVAEAQVQEEGDSGR